MVSLDVGCATIDAGRFGDAMSLESIPLKECFLHSCLDSDTNEIYASLEAELV